MGYLAKKVRAKSPNLCDVLGMPNMRARNKVFLGGYIDRKLQERITRAARAAGMERNRFGFVTGLVEKALRGRGNSKRPSAKRARGR